MHQAHLATLAHYNAYANALVFSTLAQLPAADFTRVVSPSHQSVSALLCHLLEAEAFFLAACSGQPTTPLPTPGTVATLQRYAEALATAMQAYIASLDERALAQPLSLQIGRQTLHFPRWQALTQAFVHAIHHRGELSIVLSTLGHPLPTLDILIQFANDSGQTWPAGPNRA